MVEVHSYRLEVQGAAAGRHVLRTRDEARQTRLEAELHLEGPLPPATVVQLSRCHSESMTSHEFRERTRDRQGERETRIDFDRDAGLVRMRRGDDDSAETPYLVPFRDPLSMLLEIRRCGRLETPLRIPMLGKTVLARPLGEVDLETDLGRKRALAYLVQPGGSWVWVDLDPPHAILKLSQRLPDGRLDALLVSIGSETDLPGWTSAEGGGKRRSSRKRRRRRRRGRGGGKNRGDG